MEQSKFIADEDKLKLFFYTMYERQQIWYKRFILNLPQDKWTDNKYYIKYRFTNVYRELDRASQFLIKNIILNKDVWKKYNNDKDNYINLIWKILFFRIINNPRLFTSADVIDDYNNYDADKFYKYLKENFINNNVPIMHCAFNQYFKHDVITENGNAHFDNMGEYFAKFVLPRLHNHIINIYNIMQDSLNNNTMTAENFIIYMSNNIDCCGKFIAHEFFQDLCYIEQYTGLKLMSYDANSATNAGPGSTKGCKYIFSNIKTSQDVVDAIKYLRDISEEWLDKIHKELFADSNEFYYVAWDINAGKYKKSNFNFTLNQIEMWLCEFYKYIKYTESEGKVRVRLYRHDKPEQDLLY